MKDLFKMVRLQFSPHTMYLDYMILSEQTSLMIYTFNTKMIRLFRQKRLRHKNLFSVFSKKEQKRVESIL